MYVEWLGRKMCRTSGSGSSSFMSVCRSIGNILRHFGPSRSAVFSSPPPFMSTQTSSPQGLQPLHTRSNKPVLCTFAVQFSCGVLLRWFLTPCRRSTSPPQESRQRSNWSRSQPTPCTHTIASTPSSMHQTHTPLPGCAEQIADAPHTLRVVVHKRRLRALKHVALLQPQIPELSSPLIPGPAPFPAVGEAEVSRW